MIRVGFFETNRGGLDQRPRWRKALFAGAGRGLAPRGGSRPLAGNPARSLGGMRSHIVLETGRNDEKNGTIRSSSRDNVSFGGPPAPCRSSSRSHLICTSTVRRARGAN